MDSKWNHQQFEKEIYATWEEAKAFTPVVPENPKEAKKTKKPFSIILPPPNANEPLHAGHALYVVEDIMVRYHRMLGDPTLWLPGTDHAGIETQFVYEKHLKKEGKSRFDYDRETLYNNILDYVNSNRTIAKEQLKRLGFSLDWSRERFTLDEDHNQRIFAVFHRMIKEGLVYRDEKIVNYCTYCGTAFSNLEVNYSADASNLWYFKYPLATDKSKFITVATTRPETMLGDTAIAVNPNDPRYKDMIGQMVMLPIMNKEIPIIAEETIEIDFGTGAVKVTPSHSPEDYDMGKKNNLEFVKIWDFDGKGIAPIPESYQGLYPSQIREKVVEEMTALGYLEKTEAYTHEVGHCYRCSRPIEPMTAPQWYIKIDSLAKMAIEAVSKDRVTIFPKRFKKNFLTWMKDIKDWPVSRQIVWGHRIPIWYNLDENPTIRVSYIDKNGEVKNGTWDKLKNIEEWSVIEKGLQSLLAPAEVKYWTSEAEAKITSEHVLRETDTFDTWFSSGQWPYSTLGWEADGKHNPDYDYFYPTTVLDTMWDILFFWVARMIMMGLYTTGDIPFEVAHMHSRVVDSKGVKMSKSKGNVINPITIVDQYGADALRMALVYGVAPGSDIPLSEDKVRAQRNFANKMWNAARFILMTIEKTAESENSGETEADKEILEKLNKTIKSVTSNLDKYRFGMATEEMYEFFWHDFCDVYIESTKGRDKSVVPVLSKVLVSCLKLIHPVMPFVTEGIYQEIKKPLGLTEELLATANWPKAE